MERVYKRYKADPSIPVPERTRRRHRRRLRDALNSELGLSNSVAHDTVSSVGSSDEPVSTPSFQDAHDATWNEDCHDEQDLNMAMSADFSMGSPCSTDHSHGHPVEDVSSSSDTDSSQAETSISSDGCSLGNSSTHSDDEECISFLDMSIQGSIPADDLQDTLLWSVNPSVCQTNVDFEDQCGEMRSRLCNCSEATQGEVLVAVLSLGLRHSLSYKAMVDILKLFNVIYQREVIPATLYYLLKFSEPTRSQEHVHPVCPDCGDFLGRATNESEIVCDCGCRLTSPKKSKNLIMTLGMKEQIKNLFERPGIAEALSYRFKRQKCVESNWEDVYDGSLYKNLTSNGMPLSDPNNFSYAFNTDGVAFGSSSHQQLWPVYITINELPPKLRTKHMLLVGIWVGKSEPDMQVMLRPFVQEANELSVVGVDWVCHNVMKNSKVIPLFSVVDSQARWRMLNHKCFSGYYGCTFCEISGSHTKRGMRFPLGEHVPLQRTDVSLRDGMLTAYMRRNYPEKERHYKGSRGPCALMNLRDFNLGSGLPPDSMHMLKGVVQQNLGLILGKLDDDEVTKISKRIMRLQPPSVLTRLPRALKDRDKFQCSEYRALLVIYGPVVMHGIVPPKYVGHFCLLSSAMYLLMQKSVSAAQLDQAGKMLVFYVALYQKYFGEEHMTYNIHLLLHVVKSVANLGPLHGYLTCYPFEGKNRYLLQLAKSPYEVAKGVARRYAVYNNLPNLCDRFNVSDSILNFCNQMFFRPLRSAVRSDGAVLLGRGSAAILNDEEREVLCNEMKIERPGNIRKFQRMVLDGSTYTTADYNPSYRRNDSGIVIANKPRNNKCKITNIILLEEKEAVVIFARQMKECADPLWKVGSFALKHITQIREEGQLLALRPCHVGGQCMFMSTEKGTFVTCIPHGCRGD